MEKQKLHTGSDFRIFSGDKVLWIIVAALASISVLVVYSSTAKMGYNTRLDRTMSDFLWQHIISLGMATFVLLVVHKINCRIYNRLAAVIYVLSLLLTVGVYIMGSQTNGAARWFSLFGFQFQPSEALKIATVLFLARQLASRQSTIDKLKIIPSLNPSSGSATRSRRRSGKRARCPYWLPYFSRAWSYSRRTPHRPCWYSSPR